MLPELESMCHAKQPINYSRRFTHNFKSTGEICSKGAATDDAVVTRRPGGWVWHCFRCGETGWINQHNQSPERTVEALKEQDILDTRKEVAKLTKLPKDYVKYLSYGGDTNWGAFHWLRQCGFRSHHLKDYEIGYSSLYDRVIFPVYEYAYFGDDVISKFIGWVGRNYKWSKDDKGKGGPPKWLTKIMPDIDHPVYHLPPKSPPEEYGKTVVIVEDVPSAIRLHASMGVEVFAVLNNYVPHKLFLNNKNKEIIILWLDYDQRQNMNRLVTKYSAFGLPVTQINTPLDPKRHHEYQLRNKISETVERYFTTTTEWRD